MPHYDAINFNPPAAIAVVSIRNLSGETVAAGVRLLIDTGADTTLLPTGAFDQLNRLGSLVNEVELIAFDGTLSFAPAYAVELIFAKRVYSGAYPIVQDEIGVLGRDILNHLVITFDGPGGAWQLS